MTTAVSLSLYAASVFFAASVGVTAEQFKNGKSSKSQAIASVVFTLIPFVLAASLQVFG